MKKSINNLTALIVFSFALPAAWAAAGSADLKAGRAAFEENACNSCHQVSHKASGPSLKEIAKRYKGKQAVAELVQHVREGSEGRWGEAVHPSYESLNPEQAAQVVKWILGGAPR